jgi:eukaryotic-like serine/threonine-protein kinase
MDAVRREFETAPTSDLIDSIALEAVASPPTSKTERGLGPSSSDLGASESDVVNGLIGRQVGPYQITAWIGGSRIGNVYRAIRIEEFAQPVAIMLIKHEMDRDIILRRFHTKSWLQAALGKHPNITSLVDVGTTEDRRPYFVMEYVEGKHVDEYCNDRRLDVPARLRLFAQVCQAVHFAHQHAVIHRDLTPSNILVTPNGAPRISGFGIVELVEPDADDDQAATSLKAMLSGAGAIITPEYASPEQVKGDAVTTASDIYSLGVILYQLVSGRQPYQITSPSDAEIFQAICEQVPEKPSIAITRRSGPRLDLSIDLLPSVPLGSATEPSSAPVPLSGPALPLTPDQIASACGHTPHQLRRILAGDLDRIVLMALRKEPEGRYASAEQLGDDLHCFLKGMPVRVHHDSRAYRANKFVRRHVAVVGAGLVVLLALVAGFIATTTGLVTVRRERDRAANSLREARQAIDQLFTHISEDRLFNQPGMHPLRKALLLDAQHFYEDSVKQHSAGSELRAELATAQTHLAKITSLTSLETEAVTQYHQAVALWEKLVRKEPDNLVYQANLVQTLNDLGTVLLRAEGRLDEALDTFRQAQKMVELLISAHPESVTQHLVLGLVLQNIAEIQRRQGKPDEAIASIEQALTIESQLAAEGLPSLETRIALATAHATLGRLFGGQPAELLPAITAYHRAIELREEVTREHPELAEQFYQLASELSDLSSLQQKIGQTESSVESLRRAMHTFERIDQLYPGVTSYQHGLGTTYNRLSNLERQRGERAEALAFAQIARSLFERMVSENPKNANFLRGLTKSYNSLGRLQAQAGDSAEALRSFQRAVDLFESLHALDPHDSYNLACNVALCIPLIGVKKGVQGTAQELSKGDQLHRQLYGDRAIEALRRAAEGGGVDPQTFQDEADLDSLRTRADFQALMKEVEEKSATAGKSSQS